MKKALLEEFIKRDLIFVAKSFDKNKWFSLKNGLISPFFLDMSKFNSPPDLIRKVNKFVIKTIKDKNIKFDNIIGVPYGGLPFSFGVATLMRVPCLSVRKEGPKNYGIKGEILGLCKKGDRVLILEDATATAKTVIALAKKLRKKGLIVNDVVAMVDTGMSAKENLKKQKIALHPLFTWKELYAFYKKKKPQALGSDVRAYLDKFIGA